MFHSQASRPFVVTGENAEGRLIARITLREAGDFELHALSASIDPIPTRDESNANECDANECDGCAFGFYNRYLWIAEDQQLRAFQGIGIPRRLPLSRQSNRGKVVAFRRYHELFHLFGDLLEIQVPTVTVIPKSDISHLEFSTKPWQTHAMLTLVLKSNQTYHLVRPRIFLLLDWLLTPTLGSMDVDIATSGIVGLGARLARLLQIPLKDNDAGADDAPPPG
jgi:hypothetical protein